MPTLRLSAQALLAMLAFAANSLLCRQAFLTTDIDAASFTCVRILSGACVLLLLVGPRTVRTEGSWPSALMLFVYAAGFSFAYLQLGAATGALLLFAAVQCTMIFWGFIRGERLSVFQWIGVLVAVAGLVVMMLPGLSSPPFGGAILMIVAGVAWGIYSLRGRGVTNALGNTAGNFARAVPLALLTSILFISTMALDPAGVVYGIASGALASGAGYAIWYTVLPALKATSAATIQLSVPVLTALGGVMFLAEPITPRLGLASLMILGGLMAFILAGADSGKVSGR
ncbi:DMT family transporter [Microbulbifer aggregans]|uniref:DMT family transporter n=1 Tax=Microbulbifer aggregans TaxID=1769779 RepID=UPI001CFED9A0|nr:DMT family transporter [Microbulbifer aggregans]